MNSGEWDELASDVISEITMFCFWEEYIRACGSVCQNRCRMQGICVVGNCSNTGYAEWSIPLHSIPLFRWNSTRNVKKTKLIMRSGLICAKRKSGSLLRSRVRCYYKNLQLFMACVFFSICGGKLENFMVLHTTRIWEKLEAIWLFRLFQTQAIDAPSPSHGITRLTKRIGFFYSK